LRTIDDIVVHCTADRDHERFRVGVRQIDLDHRVNRGWSGGCGYHYVVCRDGFVEVGRLESEKGAHCPPYNETSIGIAWVGTNTPTPAQYAKLVALVRDRMAFHEVPIHRVKGHKEADPTCGKACPGGLDMIAFRVAVGQ
jgi:N-acetylmuramoyl-L-alanine amidase